MVLFKEIRSRLPKVGLGRPILFLFLVVAVAVVGGWMVRQAATFEEETGRITEVLGIGPGSVVADVGAGGGDYTLFLARTVGPNGRVFSTEITEDQVEGIRETVRDAGLENVTTILGEATDTNLPAECCDAIVLRRVYHHFTDPDAMDRSLLRSLKPGGVIAIIDFTPSRTLPSVKGVPENRGGHGAPIDIMIEEMTRNGFEMVRRVEDWPGRDQDFCVLFRHPAG